MNTETHNGCEPEVQVQFYHKESVESLDQLSLVEERPSSSSSFTRSSGSLLSLWSAVTEPLSQKHITHLRKESPSLCNYFRPLMATEESSDSCQEESESDDSKTTVYEETCALTDNIQSEEFLFKTHPLIDPVGWIKCASNQDPWNEDYYFPADGSTTSDGVLTRELISECSSMLDQLPDSKAFVLTRLHIKQKGLEDISVLEHYKYFQYIDASWNCLTSLEALSNCTYLMYLNASHNKLTAVLDFKPPWFLTHVNLESNDIMEIGQNLSNFWSLRHLNLSFNFIEKIEGLTNLMYLRYLNLSHNQIKRVENLDCTHLEELNLEFNEISECDMNEGGLQGLEKIKILNLAHNKLSSLTPFQELFSLKKFDISHNCVTELYEIDNLRRVTKCYELDVTGNPVCSSTGFREFVIYVLPNLRVLNSVIINCSERVAAKMLLEPDIFTSAQHLRAKVELWNQLACKEINTETMPSDEPPVPLLVLVGTFMNGKEEIARTLVLKFPDQVYRCKKYTTLPLDKNYDIDNLITVPIDEFNIMIKTGKFIVYYKEVGFFFGICQNEISTCILEGKIGIIDTILEAALVMKYSKLHPFLVLSVTDDIESYGVKLKNSFMDLDLWNKYHSSTSNTSEYVVCLEGRSKSCSESKSNHLKTKLSHGSENHNQDFKVEMIIPSVESISRDSDEILQAEGSCRMHSRQSGSICSDCHLRKGSKRYSETNIDNLKAKPSEISRSNGLTPTIEIFDPKLSKYAKANSNEQMLSKTHNRSSDLPGQEDDSFVWTWSMDSSVGTIESEPDPAYLDLVRGTEMSVRKTLHQQETYVEMHNLQPGLFFDTVLTDDVDKAVKKIGKTCYNILKNRMNQKTIKDLLEESMCTDFVQERVNYLLKDLMNISF